MAQRENRTQWQADASDVPRSFMESSVLASETASQSVFPSAPPRSQNASEEHLSSLRTGLEAALTDPKKFRVILGDGTLGRNFPDVFGQACKGGIVGRLQHGAHEFTVDDHTLIAMEHALAHLHYSELNRAEQLELLWAVAFHDTGKRAGVPDPGHEILSAVHAKRVLTAIGYDSVCSQRICNLISRHTEVSFRPGNNNLGSRLDLLHDLALFYRYPSCVTQLRILNEADIKAIDSKSRFWTDEVARVIDENSRLLADCINQIAR